MQCTAKAKQTGERCKRHVTPGRDKCYYHGGAQPVGLARTQTIHGRYSRHLPTRLMARYQEAQADPDLLALREEITLLDARIADVLGRVDSGESGRLWQELQTTAMALRLARRQQNTEGIADALNTMLDLIGAGRADYAAWADVRTLLEQRRRLVESERRRLTEMQQTLSVEKAMLLIGAIAGIIKAHVHDRATLAKISADLDGLLRREPAAVIDGDG